MKKKILFSGLLSLVLVISCVFAFGISAETTKTMTEVSTGTAVAGDVVTISSEEELDLFSAYVSANKLTEGVTFRLTADIALSSNGSKIATLAPIGNAKYQDTSNSNIYAFKGTFDGNGKTVSNFQPHVRAKVGGSTANVMNTTIGFFAKTDGATVQNLTLSLGADIGAVGGNSRTGVLIGEANNTTVKGCSVIGATVNNETAKLTSQDTALATGGIVGKATGSVIDGCSVNLQIAGAIKAGGIVGEAVDTAVRNCTVSGAVANGKNGTQVGGIAGHLSGTSLVANCYAGAGISGKGAIGGIAGTVDATASVKNCFSNATVSTTATSFGVLVGESNGLVEHSFGLRQDPLVINVPHYDIGGGTGTKNGVYAYKVTTEGNETVFTVGTITPTEEFKPCYFAYGNGVPDDESYCNPDADRINPECTHCGGDGYSGSPWTTYRFVEQTGVSDLAAALSAWATENSTADVQYLGWAVVGDRIVNCAHASTKLVAYAGQAATCKATGLGDEVCTACNAVIQSNVTIPIDINAHKAPGGVSYACKGYTCELDPTHVVAATRGHDIDASKPCKDQECTICHEMIAHTGEHTPPTGYDMTKPCVSFTCTVCGDTAAQLAEHTMEVGAPACKELVCSVCEFVKTPTQAHTPGPNASCTRDQVCVFCNTVVTPKQPHLWGEPADCGNPQRCIICSTPNPEEPATGDHNKDREAPTCTVPVTCLDCGNIVAPATGHTVDPNSPHDCGHGRLCSTCSVVVESATGEHTLDWSTAVVIRAASLRRSGIISVKCETCGRPQEVYSAYRLKYNKVSDYADVVIADGYLPVQAITISLRDMDGNKLTMGGRADTVEFFLNQSAFDLPITAVKVYHVVDGQATEITVRAMENGIINFAAVNEDATGTYLLACEKTVAYEKIGAVQPAENQTASLIGTVSYERRDDEI